MGARTIALAGASWAALAGVAAAQTDSETNAARDARIEELERRLGDLAGELAALRAEQAEDAAPAPEVPPSPAPRDVVATVSNGRPVLQTNDEDFRFAIRGTIQFDVAHYDQDDPQSPDNRRSDSANPGDLNSGGVFRRARIGIEGTVFGDWNYGLTGEWGGSGTEGASLNQAWVEYVGWRPIASASPLRIRAGAWPSATSIDDATSASDTLFLERGAVAEMVRGIGGGDDRLGLGAFLNSERWYVGGVLTGGTTGASGEFDEQRGYIARAAALPISGEDYRVHVGASVVGVIEPADSDASVATIQTLRLRERPELRVDGSRFVDTGALPADGMTAIGLELGGAWRNLYASGQVFDITVDRSDGFADNEFGGWFVQGAWTLTGESRSWNAANGGFSSIRPAQRFDLGAGGLGAWEIAARYSVLDLDDDAGAFGAAPALGSVRGGEQAISTLGLNWYPNNAIRFLFDYQWVEIDRLDPDTSAIVTTVPGAGAQIGQDFQAISVRSQLAF